MKDIAPTHVFLATWLRQPTEAENIRVNAGMVRNLLDAVSRSGSVEHVALVTGLKHYLGPFEAYGKGTLPATPFREEQPRLAIENFYYAQEDEVFAAAERDGFGWSVHRPHTIIGYAVGNAMNMGVTLAVYASICRETGAAVSISRVGCSVERSDGYDRCAAAGPPSSLGVDDRCGTQPGFQCRERRCLSLELDVGADRQMVRRRAGTVHRRGGYPWRRNLPALLLSGKRSRPGIVWSNRISTFWFHHGTQTRIWAALSRSSLTCRRAGNSAFSTTRQPTIVSLSCSTGSGASELFPD